jgi:hypothetical protein
MSRIDNDDRKITEPTEGDYKGNPTLAIPLASGKPFTFGVEKAHAILRHTDAIQEFAAKHPSRTSGTVAAMLASLSDTDKEALKAALSAV